MSEDVQTAVTAGEPKTGAQVKNNNNNNNAAPQAEPEKKEKVIHRLKASTCPIHSVTVYNDRAEITRSITTELVEIGAHEIVIYDLSPEIEPDSIRIIGGEGNASILEVSHEEVYGDREDLDQTAILLKKIESLLADKQKNNAQLERNKKERAWLEGFAQTVRSGGSAAANPALASADLKVEGFLTNTTEFLRYYSEQSKRLDDSDFSIQESIRDIASQEQQIKKKISSLQQHHLIAFRREVSVVMHVPGKTKVVLHLSYLIMNAHWTPSYDVRMDSEDDSLELQYFGSITNASGEDWNNVHLSLSTASPSIGGAPPPLRSLRIDIQGRTPLANSYRTPQNNKPRVQKIEDDVQSAHDEIMKNIDVMLTRGERLESLMDKTEELQTQAWEFKKQTNQLKGRNRLGNILGMGNTGSGGSMTVVTAFAESSHVGAANATFEIPRASSIVSDNKPHKVTISVIQLKAKLSHYATPDTSGHVYLKASATNTTEQYPFLAGPMNTFMNGNFIAKSQMNDVSPGEKFSVFLGVDPGVRLDVKPVRRFQEKQTGMIYKNNSESFRHTSIVKNTRKDKVHLTVIVQIPVTGDDRIKVKLLHPELKGNVKFIDNKSLRWKFALAPSAQEELTYHYNVEWPSGVNIVHLAAQNE